MAYKQFGPPFKENLSPRSNLNLKLLPSPSKQNRYNELMDRHRKHPKVESPRVTFNPSKLASPSQLTHTQTHSRCQILELQNNYLLNQLVLQKEKEKNYRRKIARLKGEISPCGHKATRVVSITDLESREEEMSWEKDLGRMREQANITSRRKKEEVNTTWSSSEEYIRHTERCLSNEVDILNQRLCGLLEESTVEEEREVRQKRRKEMMGCVEELRSLRDIQRQYFSPNSLAPYSRAI